MSKPLWLLLCVTAIAVVVEPHIGPKANSIISGVIFTAAGLLLVWRIVGFFRSMRKGSDQLRSEVDGLDGDKATWVFCGAFPLVEIASGRRACLRGWRNRGDQMDMLAVVPYEGSDGSTMLGLQRETEEDVEIERDFCDVADMMSMEWFL